MPSYDSVEVGSALPERTFAVTRADLVRYAGASGDYNPIHWSNRVATAVGLPDVISHGMLTMALAGRMVTDWAGGPAAVASYGVRFRAPVVVPDDDIGAALVVSATVVDKMPDRRVEVEVAARVGDTEVLAGARATVQLS